MLLNIIIFTIFCSSFTGVLSENACSPRYYNGADTNVCVCNATYCDTIEPVKKLLPSQYVSYTTNKAGLRFQKLTKWFNTNKTPQHFVSSTDIKIDPKTTYQNIIGFGGAISDSAALNIYSLDVETRKYILKSYYSSEGIECNTGRIPIGATDFSTHGYTYDDGNSDPQLTNFQLAPEDLQYKIPLAKWANQLTNNTLYLFAAAWTAPKWMKTNGEYNGFGFIKTEMLEPWANYFLKFLEEYHKQGVDFWGISTGNEPLAAFYNPTLNSVGWLPISLGSWIADYLGPALRTSLIKSIKYIQLLLLDDITTYLPWFVDIVMANKQASKYINGIASHWYADLIIPYNVLTQTHDHHPETFILATEASLANVTLGSWRNAELYIQDIISNLENWVTGWTEWNIALNLEGGPSYTNSSLDASFIVNATADEFYKQPTFYAFGHFAKFLPRNSTRISISVSNEDMRAVAFKRPDGGSTIVVHNPSDGEVPLTIKIGIMRTIYEVISARSITTILYW